MNLTLEMGNPMPLRQNAGKSFQGSIVLGKGFVLTTEEAERLINKNPRNKEVLFPYLNGDDLNNDPEQKPSRWVINFFDWSEEKARTYPDCFEIVEKLVRPERGAYDETKNSWNKSVKTNWWLFGAWRKALDVAMSKLDQVMVISEVTKYVSFVFTPVDIVFMHTVKVITWSDWESLALLNSSIYCEWSWKYSSTMGSGTLRYTPSSCFDTFPFPNELADENKEILGELGEQFYNCRKRLMVDMGLGLTKVYNLFHTKKTTHIEGTDFHITNVGFIQKYGKEANGFKKHSQNLNNLKYNFFIGQIEKLRSLIVKINETILKVYGWNDIMLQHDFYELEYLPENDRIRFTIHPEARKEILKRLLKLNYQIHDNEVKSNSNSEKKTTLKTNDSFPTLF